MNLQDVLRRLNEIHLEACYGDVTAGDIADDVSDLIAEVEKAIGEEDN